MKSKFTKIDKLVIFSIFILVLGIISSFIDFGIISVFFSVTMPLIFIINSALAIYGIFKKKYFYLVGVLVFLLSYNFFFQFSQITDLETKDSISILTYNVRAFKQHVSRPSKQNTSTEIIKFIDSVNADITVFQESNYKEGKKLKGYPYYFLGYRPDVDKTLLVIYSKYPIINEGYIDFPSTKNNGIYVDLKIQKDTIRVYNIHLQSFVITPHIIANKYTNYNYLNNLNNTITKQVEQAKLIKNHANKSNKKVIICGDFNATPYSQPYRILKKGLNDSYFSKGNGFGETYSRLNYPLRLDYFLSDKKIKVVSHKNFNLNLSDHEPIYIKFKII